MAHPYFRPVNFDDIYHKRVPPPFIPQLQSATDTSNFDQEFTREVPVLTPVHSGTHTFPCIPFYSPSRKHTPCLIAFLSCGDWFLVLTPDMQEQFRGFSFVADPDSIWFILCEARGCGGFIPVLVGCGGGHNCTLVHVLLSPGEEDGNIAFRIRFSNTLFPLAHSAAYVSRLSSYLKSLWIALSGFEGAWFHYHTAVRVIYATDLHALII